MFNKYFLFLLKIQNKGDIILNIISFLYNLKKLVVKFKKKLKKFVKYYLYLIHKKKCFLFDFENYFY